MTIVVISDTHMPKKAKSLPAVLLNALANCDHIIHAGDVNDYDLIFELEAYAPLSLVAGNTDGFDIIRKYGYKKIIDIAGKKIGIIHGNGSRNTLDNVWRAFMFDSVDCIVYGHSHIAKCEYIDDVLYLNPGSPTDKRLSPEFSFGILKIEEDIIYPHIVFFDLC